MTLIAVVCNIEELNFTSYFVLKEDSADDTETLALNSPPLTPPKYMGSHSDNDDNSSQSSNSEQNR